MLDLALKSLYFFLPGFLSNSAGTLSMKIPVLKNWKTPVDLGLKLGKRRLFGSHKTYRGFALGIVFSLVTGYVQYVLNDNGRISDNMKFYDYSSLGQTLLLSVLLGFGALFGDLVKSFLKRRIGIKPGAPWWGFDQMDYIVGGLLLGALVYWPGCEATLFLLVFSPIANLSSNFIAYKLKLKEVWY